MSRAACLVCLVLASSSWGAAPPARTTMRQAARSALERLGHRIEAGGKLRLAGAKPRLEEERQIDQVLLNVEVAYWNLVGSRQLLRSRELGLAVAREALLLARNRNDANAARSQAAMFASQRGLAQDTVRENERQLAALSGLDGPLLPSDAPACGPCALDWKAALKEALARRPELRQARLAKPSDRAREELKDQEAKTESFLLTYFKRLSADREQVEMARACREAYTAELQAKQADYAAGKIASNQVLESQRFWAETLTNEHSARARHANAQAGFAFARGASRDRHGFVLAE